MNQTAATDDTPHIPVLLQPILDHVAPISGDWIDGTFGAGGYTRALLDQGAEWVGAVDRDPLAFQMAEKWAKNYGDRLTFCPGVFSELDQLAGKAVDGVVLDLGVSSMQLDQAERGFSFMKDGPLDMRMGQAGASAADLVNGASEETLADILYHYGEERASRRIARAIIRARETGDITTTAQLAHIVETCLPRKKPKQSHPATRSFQAIRIAVNDEFGELVKGLEAAERALKPGGVLAVVTFHSMEDRVVKRFLQHASSAGGGGSRYAPQEAAKAPRFHQKSKKAIAPSAAELSHNPRARSARLRIATRTDVAAKQSERNALGLPKIALRAE